MNPQGLATPQKIFTIGPSFHALRSAQVVRWEVPVCIGLFQDEWYSIYTFINANIN